MTLYLPDTNTLSIMLRGDAVTQSRFREAKRAGSILVLSPVVEYEVRRGLIRKQASRLQRLFEELIETLEPRTPAR